MNSDTLSEANKAITEDFLPLKGTDHIEFWVGNAKQASFFYQYAFGFQLVAYAGPETGLRDRASYVLQQGKVRFVLTSALDPDHEISRHNLKHGDGVKYLSLWVDDAAYSYEETVKRGAKSFMEPTVLEDKNGKVTVSAIHTYGETIHKFIDRSEYNGPFLPGYESAEGINADEVGLEFIDHCVGNVELGAMDKWVKFYEDVMGFQLLITFDDEDISTEYSALMSKVVSNGNGYVKFPINEPADGKRKSQIEEYLDFYKTGGVQHVAIATNDIIHTVGELRKRGVKFLYVPDEYYDDLAERVGDIKEDMAILKDLNILVDRDDEGYLLQIFTMTMQDRPTVFFEIIQRQGAKSFGKGNFKALFEAIEREQERRGTF